MNRQVMLTAEQAQTLAERLGAVDPTYGPTLRSYPVTAEQLPASALYPGTQFIRVQADLRHRPMILRVAKTGEAFVVLGTPAGVAALNLATGLRLGSSEQAAEYVRFWYRFAGHRTRTLVETADEFDWLPASADDPQLRSLRARAGKLAHHVAIGKLMDGVFPVEATVLDQRTLESCRLQVGTDGQVTETDRTALLSDIPVPYVML